MSALLRLLIAIFSASQDIAVVEKLRSLDIEIRRVARQESLKVWHAAMRTEKKKLEELGEVDPWDPDQEE